MPLICVNGTALYCEEHGTGPQTIVFAHGLLWSRRMCDAKARAAQGPLPRRGRAWSAINAHYLVKKEWPMMKGQTKHLTGQVRETLLALPDTLLMETLGEWLDDVDEQLLDWGLEQFYHSVIALAGEALALQASEEAWGFRRRSEAPATSSCAA